MKGRFRKSLLVAGALVAAVSSLAASSAADEVEIPIPNLESSLHSSLTQWAIPAHNPVPVAFHIGGKFRNRDGTRVPELREMEIEADRRGAIDVEGLPTCGRRELPKGPPPTKKCAGAIVGMGYASVETDFPQWTPMNISTELPVYNAGVRGGVTRLWISGYLSPIEPGRVFVPVKIRKTSKGRYGWKARVTIPSIFKGHGSITELNLTLQKRIITASCPDDHLVAKIRSTFSDGTQTATTSFHECG